MHIDIVDYPGEWRLDLSLLDQTFDAWSADTLDRAQARDSAKAFLELAKDTDGSAKLDETKAQGLARSFTAYLNEAREQGFSDCTPGRFLLPGELEGSPVLTFAPLPPGESPRGSLRREMARRYEAYKSQVVKPFFRNHFARIDRQVVLVDALGANCRTGPRTSRRLRICAAQWRVFWALSGRVGIPSCLPLWASEWKRSFSPPPRPIICITSNTLA